jgi:MoxR-like ATPase
MVSATTHAGLKDAEPAMDVETLLRLQALVRDIEIGDHLLRYATRLVRERARPWYSRPRRVR